MIFLDVALLLMISVCAYYCFILSRRIKDLQNSRAEFARMIKELNASILKAEYNIDQMNKLSKVTSDEIKSLVNDAHSVSDVLGDRYEIAQKMLEKLEKNHNDIKISIEEYENITKMIQNFSDEKFTDDDFSEEYIEDDHIVNNNHEQSMKSNNIYQSSVNYVREEKTSPTLNQASYYNTLRKISSRNR